MSDTEVSGRALPWTEEAKVQFLLRIISQYRSEGKSISWSKIEMPGRTTKGLQNMWTKINKTIDELDAQQQNGGNAPATPVKKATPRKRASKKIADPDVDDDEVEQETPKKATPRKRAAPGTASKRGKKAKKEDVEPSPIVKDEDASVKEEIDEDDDDN